MKMLKKIFNSDSKYYLELDEIEDSKPVQAVTKTAEKVADVVQEKATEVVESKPVQTAIETAKDIAPEQLQSSTTEAKPKAEAKTSSEKKADKKTEPQTAPSPQNAGASSFEPPFWVAAMYNNSTSTVNSDGTQKEQTFATDNLMPTITKYRRRPGPSLNKFKEMASKAKTPKG
ncbi:MAG: hypothetical protein QNJ72_02105 [Pleurocapsa sp. MO_226.B13]|nr:hypothetical protein [Pleurocapsa sp. MO_226.B13]